MQCCGSGSGTGSVRIRNFWPDPDPIRIRNKHSGSGFEYGCESGSETGSKTNLSKGVLFLGQKKGQLWNISTFPRLTDNSHIGIHCPVTFCAGVNFVTCLRSTAARWFISRMHDSNPSRIPDTGVKKAPDPGSGSATLQKSPVKILAAKENLRPRMWPNFINDGLILTKMPYLLLQFVF
jgi:hypothetical protein